MTDLREIQTHFVETWRDAGPAVVAWGAGIFEGEGCFKLEAARPYAQVIVTSTSTDRDVLERMQSIFGGRIATVKGDARAAFNWKTAYHWRITDTAGVLRFIDLVYPYLLSRRRARADEVRKKVAGVKPQGTYL